MPCTLFPYTLYKPHAHPQPDASPCYHAARRQPTPNLCNACCLWRHQPAAPGGVACADAQQRSDATLTQANSNSRRSKRYSCCWWARKPTQQRVTTARDAWRGSQLHGTTATTTKEACCLPGLISPGCSRQQQHYGRSANCKAWVAAHTLSTNQATVACGNASTTHNASPVVKLGPLSSQV